MQDQIIDPEISRQKFLSELEKFRAAEGYNRKRGIILIKAEYPDIVLAFMAMQLNPAALIFGVKFNFENYDLEPLSVRFVNPFTMEYIQKEPNVLYKIDDGPPQNYAQRDMSGLPFVCLPGVREYHEHPAHTGNNWLLHRNVGGEGSLGYLVDKLYLHGVKPVMNFTLPMNFTVQSASMQINFNVNNIG